MSTRSKDDIVRKYMGKVVQLLNDEGSMLPRMAIRGVIESPDDEYSVRAAIWHLIDEYQVVLDDRLNLCVSQSA